MYGYSSLVTCVAPISVPHSVGRGHYTSYHAARHRPRRRPKSASWPAARAAPRFRRHGLSVPAEGAAPARPGTPPTSQAFKRGSCGPSRPAPPRSGRRCAPDSLATGGHAPGDTSGWHRHGRQCPPEVPHRFAHEPMSSGAHCRARTRPCSRQESHQAAGSRGLGDARVSLDMVSHGPKCCA